MRIGFRLFVWVGVAGLVYLIAMLIVPPAASFSAKNPQSRQQVVLGSPSPTLESDSGLPALLLTLDTPKEVDRESDKEEERVTTMLKLGGKQCATCGKPVLQDKGNPKTAYLTFDDGPSESTPRILQVLREKGVKATFFVIGKTSEENKERLRNIVQEGHAVGNHTFSHDYNRIYASAAAFKADVDKLNRFLEQTVGLKPEIIRYPGGSNNHLSWHSGGRNVMAGITRETSKWGYQYFDWNVSSTDAASAVQSKADIVSSVKFNSSGKRQAIVLMHDMDKKTTTVEALPEIINYLYEQGYTFDVLRKQSFTYQFLKP